MEPTSTDIPVIRSRDQFILGCIQVWAKCLASSQNIEEALCADPATSEVRLNLQTALQNALKEEWSLAATVAGTKSLHKIQAGMPAASTGSDCSRKGSSAAASASVRNTHLVEDILWKEVFYKPLSVAKRLKRPNTWSTNDIAVVRTYLEDGIDYYLSLLNLLSLLYSSTSGSSTTRTSVVVRCLCCLGDLSRYYCTDLPPQKSPSPASARFTVPAQYYYQVLELSPGAALAHSNLASVLRSFHNAPLQAALHYLAALQYSRFEGARFQLKQLLDNSFSKYQLYCKHEHTNGQRQKSSFEGHFLNTVLATVSCFTGRDGEVSHVEVNAICQDFLVQLSKLLQTSAGYSITRGDSSKPMLLGEEVRTKAKETSETVLLIAALLISAQKLQTPQQGTTCAVLLASVLLTVVSRCMSDLQHTITSVHSDDILLALTLATTPRSPTQPKGSKSTGSSSGEHYAPVDCHSDADKENEPNNTAGTSGLKKRPVPRRRRLRRRRQTTKGDWNFSRDSDDSSCDEDFSSNNSDWSSGSREDSEVDSCSSESDSGEDVIIESEDEVVAQGSIPANKGGRKSASSPASSIPASNSCATASKASGNEHLSAASLDRKNTSTSPPFSLSASEHLRLISLSDGGHDEKGQQEPPSSPPRPETQRILPHSIIPTMKAMSVDDASSGGAALEGRSPPSSLLATTCVLTAWLRAESTAKGVLVWSNAENSNEEAGGDGEVCPDAGNVESSRVLWKALAAYCNLITVDARFVSSTADLHELLPNLRELVLQCQRTDCTANVKTFIDAMLKYDHFVLPEDDFLKSTVPSVVPRHVLKQPPGVQCPHVAPYLCHVGVTNANYFKHMVDKLSLSEPHPNGGLSPTTPTVKGETSVLNPFEESFLRSLRLRHDLLHLSEFEECPLRYCEETGLFSVLPRANCTPSSASSSTAGSVSNNGNCKPYYLKKVAFGGYVMDKLVHRRNRSGELQQANTTRGKRPNRRERRRVGKNGRQPSGRGRRRQHDRNGEFARETTHGRRRDDLSTEDLPHGRRGIGRQNRRREEKSLHYKQPAEDCGAFAASFSLLLDKRSSREVGKYVDGNSASSGGSPVNAGYVKNEYCSLVDFKDASRIIPGTVTPTNGKFGVIGDRRKAATAAAVAADRSLVADCAATLTTSTAETFGGGPMIARSNTPVVNADDDEAATKLRRYQSQRMLTARWLRHKLDTSDSKPLTYLVPDASAIVYCLETIKTIVDQGQTVVVVPMQVLSDIDEAKRHESAARDASRWLDRVLLGRRGRVPKNATLRLQGANERADMPGVQCPPKHHKTAWRWFQILECCHHLSRLEYSPKESACEEDALKSKPVKVVRSTGSLYSDKQPLTPVLKNKNKNSQQTSRTVCPSNEASLVPKFQDDSLMDKAAVVTLLTAETGETISKLPFGLSSLASRVAAKLVFVSDYKKTLTSSQGHT